MNKKLILSILCIIFLVSIIGQVSAFCQINGYLKYNNQLKAGDVVCKCGNLNVLGSSGSSYYTCPPFGGLFDNCNYCNNTIEIVGRNIKANLLGYVTSTGGSMKTLQLNITLLDIDKVQKNNLLQQSFFSENINNENINQPLLNKPELEQKIPGKSLWDYIIEFFRNLLIKFGITK
jgi:hypothetical protein